MLRTLISLHVNLDLLNCIVMLQIYELLCNLCLQTIHIPFPKNGENIVGLS